MLYNCEDTKHDNYASRNPMNYAVCNRSFAFCNPELVVLFSKTVYDEKKEMKHMTCGEKIAIIRKENNLTQEQFAEMMNVSRQSVSKWELGTSFPDTEKLIKISKLFSCSLDYLLKDEIESKDINQLQESDHARRNYYLGIFYTYLSFAPLFGFIVGIYGTHHHKQTGNHRKMIRLTLAGITVSVALTAAMLIGIIFQL